MLPESLRRLAFSVVGATALALVTTTSAFAQGSAGKIQGRVVDAQTGQPIAAAQVEVVGTNRGNITNDDGYYFINDVPAGLTDIRAVSIGYGAQVVNDQRILAGQTHTQNFSLSPSAVEIEEIVVEGERNPLVPRDQVSSRAIVTGETIDELPLDNASSIVALQPGVITTNQGVTIRGSRPNEEATYVDGVLVRRFQSGSSSPLELPTNALAQVDVTTGGISARYSDAQAGVVQYTTRQGGRDFTGTLGYQTDALGPQDWRTGFHRGELSVGGPIFGALNFFLAGTVEGRKYGAIAPGTQLFVATGVDTTFMIPTTEAGSSGLVDSVQVAFPTFERWDNGPTNPFNQSDEYNFSGRLGYGIGNGSNLSLAYYRTRDQGMNRALSELFNPQGWDGFLNEADVVTLGGYFVLAQTSSQAIALDVKASYQSFRDQSGVVDPSWLADHTDPALGFNFSTIDFIVEPDDFPVTDELLLGARAGVLPATMFQVFPGRTDLADRQTVAGVADPLRINPWGLRSRLPIAGFGGTAGALGTGTQGLEYLNETNYALNASVDWQAGRFNRIFVGGDYVDINTERNFIGLFDGAGNPAKNTPVRAGMFVQDRLDLGDVVLEGGLRMDYFDPNATYPRVPGYVSNVPDSLTGDAYTLDPLTGPEDDRTPLDRLTAVEDCGGAATAASRTRDDGTVVCKNNFVDAETKMEWSPRLAVSFPVTSTSTFRLSYSHNVQVPALQQSSFGGQAVAAGQTALFSDVYADLQSSLANTNSLFGRDVDLPRTVIFEAGYRRLFGESLVFDIAAYSKTIRNGLTYRKLPYIDPVSERQVNINSLTNADYTLTRGVDLRVDKRFGELADLSLNYSWIDARGTGSDPYTYTGLLLRGSSNLALATGQPVAPPEVMFPLEQSRTHNFSGTFSFHLPSDYDFSALSDVGVFATFSAASGLPFTRLVNAGSGQTGPPSRAGGSAEIAEQVNASETPWTRAFDLRVHKGFNVGATHLRLFADWRNPFDIETISTVFLETGTTVNDQDRATELSTHLVDSRLDGDTNVDDFYVQCVGSSDNWDIAEGGDATCDVPDNEPVVNAYSLQQAEALFGNADGNFTVEEQERAFGAWYKALVAGEQFLRRSDQSLRLGVELVF